MDPLLELFTSDFDPSPASIASPFSAAFAVDGPFQMEPSWEPFSFDDFTPMGSPVSEPCASPYAPPSPPGLCWIDEFALEGGVGADECGYIPDVEMRFADDGVEELVEAAFGDGEDAEIGVGPPAPVAIRPVVPVEPAATAPESPAPATRSNSPPPTPIALSPSAPLEVSTVAAADCPSFSSPAPTSPSSTATADTDKVTKPAQEFVCPHPGCERSFSRKFNMKMHASIHDVNRTPKYPCSQCGRSFHRNPDLVRHRKTHVAAASAAAAALAGKVAKAGKAPSRKRAPAKGKVVAVKLEPAAAVSS
ncbi:hypothetical protein BDK51DRAFT_38015 [Blyttiomyces helicus]|uniref:C2H2-type domain-containing protein n=1 Tax=Blyttiomyces helicus TaxID=388810 RepID=A0A4P9WIA1_9FUNG|nr:hypothetical protein BDK51DRAFT_38015 [Blyttiomyces helicus]|eukprot:RKO91603.1 hypothetical protein BDK51DRAFT_38015 [Blyttiomyces helicus]